MLDNIQNNMLADYHIHSNYSDDSKEPMQQTIEQAIKMGFDEICFTDHVDYGIKVDLGEEADWKLERNIVYNVDYDRYFQELADWQAVYQNRLTIKKGLEFGIQTHTAAKFEQLFQRCDLDFVILSCHQVNDLEFWNYEFQKGKTAQEYNQRYYEEIDACVSMYKNYSVLGHLDMIQRYNDGIYPLENTKEIIEKILKQVIADGKGIEVNTSSFRYGLRDLMPAYAILELYYKLGGRIITIGSDCHVASDFGDHIPEVRQQLKTIGFREFCTFEKMTPIFHKL